jgi:hypothetical protein
MRSAPARRFSRPAPAARGFAAAGLPARDAAFFFVAGVFFSGAGFAGALADDFFGGAFFASVEGVPGLDAGSTGGIGFFFDDIT